MLGNKINLPVDYTKAGVSTPAKSCGFVGYELPTYGDITEILRPAVIICPGGAYAWISDREGEPVAEAFTAHGISAYVLSYTCAPNGYFPTALVEVFAAIRYVREHAAEHHIDPNRIYVCGFSAGGHAAAAAGVFWNHPIAKSLGFEGTMHRPDGMILGYPVITDGEVAHRDSFRNLHGSTYDEGQGGLTSLELRVTKDTPRTFIWHTAADNSVPAQNSLLFADALIRCGVETELHIYPRGEHGLSTARFDVLTPGRFHTDPFMLQTVRSWTDDAIRFIFA